MVIHHRTGVAVVAAAIEVAVVEEVVAVAMAALATIITAIWV
jgi:hypothetical protein